MERAFRDGGIQTTGTAVARILPPVSPFAADGGRAEKKQRVLTRLGEFFERFFGLSGGGGGDHGRRLHSQPPNKECPGNSLTRDPCQRVPRTT